MSCLEELNLIHTKKKFKWNVFTRIGILSPSTKTGSTRVSGSLSIMFGFA
jgi:hypothetical protein